MADLQETKINETHTITARISPSVISYPLLDERLSLV